MRGRVLLLPLRARESAVPGHLQGPVDSLPARAEEEPQEEAGQEGPVSAAAPPVFVRVRRDRDTDSPRCGGERLVVGD